MSRDPQFLYMLVNILLLVVVALVGWLLKRAVSSNDHLVQSAIKELKEVSSAVSKLQLLIVGDYYPRKEHNEYAHHIEVELTRLRENVHGLRDQAQSLLSRLTVVESSLNTMKEALKR